MTRIGLICPAASGHLNPMTTLGRALQQRGHTVTLIGVPDAEPKAIAAGIGFRAIAAEDYPAGSTRADFQQLGELSGLAAFRFSIALFVKATRHILTQLPSALRALDIELLLIDQVSFGASSVAEAEGIPFVTVACALLLTRDPWVPPFNQLWPHRDSRWARARNQLGYQLNAWLLRPITRIVADYRRDRGLVPFAHPNDADSSLLQLSQQPPEFEYPRPSLPRCLHFTGPYIDPASRAPAPFPFDRLDGRPPIYASLGTLQNQVVERFRAIAAACEPLDVQLAIGLGGGRSPEDLEALPGAPLVAANAPQLELLQRAALTVTHAGLNTVLESLRCGVPLVAMPIANDQPGVAMRLAWSGAGEVLAANQTSPDRLRATIARGLTTPIYRDRARDLQAAIARAGGQAKAAELVETVARTGQPVLRDERCVD